MKTLKRTRKLSDLMTEGMRRTRPSDGSFGEYVTGYSLPKVCPVGAINIVDHGSSEYRDMEVDAEDTTDQRLFGPPISTLPGGDVAYDLQDQIITAYDGHGWSRTRIRNALRRAGL